MERGKQHRTKYGNKREEKRTQIMASKHKNFQLVANIYVKVGIRAANELFVFDHLLKSWTEFVMLMSQVQLELDWILINNL